MGTDLLVIVIVIAILWLIGKALGIVLDDFKTRTKKFQPGLIDLIKTVIRYALYWVAFVVTLTVLLDIVNFAHLDIVIWFVVGLSTYVGMQHADCDFIRFIPAKVERQIGGYRVRRVAPPVHHGHGGVF